MTGWALTQADIRLKIAILPCDSKRNFYGMELLAKAIGQWLEPQTGFAGIYKLMGIPLVPVALNGGIVSPRDIFSWKSGVITYAVQPEID